MVDAGAARALARESSLLPAGVRAVEGSFHRGDPVSVRDEAGRELARGLAAYDMEDARRIAGHRSEELEKILGWRGRDEIVHRDDLVLMPRAAQPRAPVQRRAPGRGAGGEAGLQQVAAGRRLPVQHLAGGEDAGAAMQHQALVHLLEASAAGRGDGAIEARIGAMSVSGSALTRRESGAVGAGMQRLLHQADRHRRQARRGAGGWPATAAARRRRAGRPAPPPPCRAAGRAAGVAGPSGRDGVAQGGGQGIDRAALEPAAVTTASPRTVAPPKAKAMRFSGAPGEAVAEMVRPGDAEAAIGRAQRRDATRLARIAAQAPSEPSRGQEAPPSARTVAAGRDAARAFGRLEGAARRRSQPSQRCRVRS